MKFAKIEAIYSQMDTHPQFIIMQLVPKCSVVGCLNVAIYTLIPTIQFCIPFRMAIPIRPVLEIDIVLDSFICTVHTTVSAVAGDTDLVRVNRFKLYLLTAAVPLTTISCGLCLEPDEHVDTTGISSAVCQGILTDIIKKVQFLQDLPKSQRVLALLN